jgi:hypothetical protein
VSGDPMCTVCEGAGWNWRRAADEQLQVDDPVVNYRCPCVEVMRLRAEVERLRAAGNAMADNFRRHVTACGVNDGRESLSAWEEACRG